ncbi:MAG: sulfotransferase [Gammaproteobacteria bacterium]|nr:sulfotransferase [Gammaproteobacteria bacterium]
MSMNHNSLYIHIGYPKTATTWLQRCVFPELDGVSYLHFQDERYGWLNELVQEHDFSFNVDNLRDKFNNSVQGLGKDNKYVISWESLAGDVFTAGANAESLSRRLKDVFPEASIIITIRNQLDMVESIYRQYIHEGGSLSINDFLDLASPSPVRLAREHFFYDRIVDNYQTLFGVDRVKVLVYEDLKKDKAEFLRQLTGFVGVESNLSRIEARCVSHVNVGMSAPSLFIARILNRLVYSHFNLAPLIPRWLVSARHVRFVLQRVVDPVLFRHLDGRSSLLNEDVYKEWSDYYRESNQRLQKKLGLKLDSYGYPV